MVLNLISPLSILADKQSRKYMGKARLFFFNVYKEGPTYFPLPFTRDAPRKLGEHYIYRSGRFLESTGIFQKASDSPGTFSRRVFRREGVTANFRVIFSLAAR